MSVKERRIIITEYSKAITNTIKGALKGTNIQLRLSADGKECLEQVEKFRPHLIIMDLKIAKMHGIEVLKAIKSNPETKGIGVIITTNHAIAQDYHTALNYGADYCLIKPFTMEQVRKVVDDFFAGVLKPAPFYKPIADIEPNKEVYQPKQVQWESYIKFWGTRGSIPVAGIDYYRYGGNTSCLEVTDGDDIVIIDAGTGIRALGNHLLEREHTNIHLFIGHTHWDHIIGFPFFAPVYDSKYTIHIYAARGFHKSMQELFTGMLDHDFFPVSLEDMEAKFEFHDLVDYHPIKIGNLRIHYESASHPGATLCFKIESKHRTIGYCTDNEFLVGYHGHPAEIDRRHPILDPYDDIINFYTGCDSLVHEAQYTPEVYLDRTGWGHSSISNAAILLKHCKAPEWVATHHDPSDSDTHILKKLEIHREVIRDCNLDCRSFMAYDGLVLPLE